MNQHLSREQISRWMIGEATALERDHVCGCPDCAATVARMEGAVALFRDAVEECGARYAGSPQVPLSAGVRRARRTFAARPSRWAPAAAVLLLLAALPIYTNSRERRREAERARADAALLEQVDAEISRAVPGPMEPLVKLVSWNAASGEQTRSGDTK